MGNSNKEITEFSHLEWIKLQAQIEANALKEFALRPIPVPTIKSETVKTEQGCVNFITVSELTPP